jgi:hypothetical protein
MRSRAACDATNGLGKYRASHAQHTSDNGQQIRATRPSTFARRQMLRALLAARE